MSVRQYVRLSTKIFSDSSEIWYVGRGRWVMHDDRPYDPIQGQGHGTFKVRNSSIFIIYLLHHFLCELANDHWFWNYRTISNFCTEQIFDTYPSFCVTWLWTWKGLSSVCKCFCNCNNVRQVAAAFAYGTKFWLLVRHLQSVEVYLPMCRVTAVHTVHEVRSTCRGNQSGSSCVQDGSRRHENNVSALCGCSTHGVLQ